MRFIFLVYRILLVCILIKLLKRRGNKELALVTCIPYWYSWIPALSYNNISHSGLLVSGIFLCCGTAENERNKK